MSKTDPALKGKFAGNCNRTACQAPGAHWWNPNTSAYYCGHCAMLINRHIPLQHPEWRLTLKTQCEGCEKP